ncbi:hypothetical protein E3T46_14265 [Cryobacterium sp. Hh11]|uniref:hypothetical protein n=1 Tax=Cryobacterium sp. Hh11 TaxID=2555868 RepID=UPI00106A00A2|nr:hypothetical protein [Cryobacterium sp. Hh11]TFD49252.1 hypothetical protein E3T46_14265 [Cryobacterium sp. Hh11]
MSTFSLIDLTKLTTCTLVAIAIVAAAAAAVAASDGVLGKLAHRVLPLVVHVPDAQLVAVTVEWWRRRLAGMAGGVLVGTAAASTFVWWVGANRSHPVADLIVAGGSAGGIFWFDAHPSGPFVGMLGIHPRYLHQKHPPGGGEFLGGDCLIQGAQASQQGVTNQG